MTDRAQQHFKNKFQIANLVHHKEDFKQSGIIVRLLTVKAVMTASVLHLKERNIKQVLLLSHRMQY